MRAPAAGSMPERAADEWHLHLDLGGLSLRGTRLSAASLPAGPNAVDGRRPALSARVSYHNSWPVMGTIVHKVVIDQTQL